MTNVIVQFIKYLKLLLQKMILKEFKEKFISLTQRKIYSYRVQETYYCLKEKKTTKSMRNDKHEHESTEAISVLKQLNPSPP